MEKRVQELLQNKGGSYILPFFWQHGEDEATLREYMGVIYDANIREVCVESRPHPDYCGEKWWTDIDVIMDEARKRGMRVWILDDAHFPSGYGNGAYDNCPPELCKQYLKFATAEVYGPSPDIFFDINAEMREMSTRKAMSDRPIPMRREEPPIRSFDDDRLLGVYAYKYVEGNVLGERIDLNEYVKDGILRWNVPNGRWRIYAAFNTRNNAGVTSYMNVLDADSVRLIIDGIYEPHYQHYAQDFGKTLAGFFSDEPLFGNFAWNYTMGVLGTSEMALPWNKDVPAMLEERLGKDWISLTPMLWNENSDHELTATVRAAYMNVISQLVKEHYSLPIGNWCEAHGVEYIGHIVEDMGSSGGTGNSLGHFFRSMAGMHMGGVDVIGGQYIPAGENRLGNARGNFYHYTLGKLGTSYSHLDPRKQGRSMIELFGAYGWEFGIRNMKHLADHFLVSGVNRYVPHAFSPRPFPDRDCPPHFYAHGENPQYRHFGKLMEYMQRVSHLTSGGLHIAPVALLHSDEATWAGGLANAGQLDIAARKLLENQIDFDFVAADLFCEPEAYTLDKKLHINGESFAALVVPKFSHITEAFYQFTLQAAKKGFPIYFIDQFPSGVIGAKPELQPHGAVVSLTDLPNTLREIGAYDVKLGPAFPSLRYYRYHHENDVYIFSNESLGEVFTGTITVPTEGSAYVYDAYDNVVRPLTYRSVPGGTELTVTVRPYKPVIVVFGDSAEKLVPELDLDGYSVAKKPMELDSWDVSICESKEYPQFHDLQKMNGLASIGDWFPDFSGFIRYETVFEIDQGADAILEIEDAYEGVEVWCNGEYIGMRIAPRFLFDLTGALREGENELRIEVATNLERKTDKMLGKTFSLYQRTPARLPIGMVGRVRLHTK